jgi:uracil-DNA glycosylase family 4
VRVEPEGPVPCNLALFGERPVEGYNFGGRVGRQLWSDMRRYTGLSRDDFYLSNIVKTQHPRNAKPKPAEIAMALPEFLDELEDVQPRVVITAGTIPTQAVLGPVKLADVHGIPHAVNVAGHNFICLGYLAAIAFDLGSVSALLRGALPAWTPGAPTRTSWFSRDAARFCEASRWAWLALDTEGWAAKPWGLSFTPNGTDGFVIKASDRAGLDWFRRWAAVTEPLGFRIMHNGIHDAPVLRALGIEIGRYDDTQVLGYHDIIRTGSGILEAESQNLGTLAYRECGMRLGELKDIPGVDFKTQTIPYSDEVMRYAALDPIATWRLFDVYARRGLTAYEPYQIDMGQVALVERMVSCGIPFDVDDTTQFYADVCDKLGDANTDLKEQAARFGNRDFNPGSHPQVREIITRKIGLRIRKRTKSGLASTNEKALANFKDNKFVKRLQDRRELDKLRGTYLVPLLQELVV